jgi:hypothetical protein
MWLDRRVVDAGFVGRIKIVLANGLSSAVEVAIVVVELVPGQALFNRVLFLLTGKRKSKGKDHEQSPSDFITR